MARGARENPDYRSERDVEHKLLRPLFEDVLGYPQNDLHWNESVSIQMGRSRSTKAADLVAYRGKTAVIAVEAKRPTEPVRAGLSQVDSYAFALQTPYSIVTNGLQLVLRGCHPPTNGSTPRSISCAFRPASSSNRSNLSGLRSWRAR